MINCPKCQVPNPDNATACAACGAPLVGQQFAQALGEAQQQADGAPPLQPGGDHQQPASAPQQPGGDHQQPAPQQPVPDAGIAPVQDAAPLGAYDGAGMGMGMGQGQNEIAQFLAEQKSRKRTKMFIYFAIGVVLAGVIGFFWYRRHKKEQREQEVIAFFSEFRKIDDGLIADFWKCAVRAKDRDVRLASNAAEITEGLKKAFSNFPKSQPDRIRDKCLPLIPAAIEEMEKLEPPEGFAEPLAIYQENLKQVQESFEVYAAKIDKRKQQAADEQEVRDAHSDFHQVRSGGGWASVQDTPKAVQYFNIMRCVIPDLVKKARKLRQPPDSQPIVDLYHECKADPAFADKIRKECFAERNSSIVRSPEFKKVAQKMSGDDRDLNTINYCFRKANHGYAFEELKAVAQAFGEYRNKGRAQLLKAVQHVKEELAE